MLKSRLVITMLVILSNSLILLQKGKCVTKMMGLSKHGLTTHNCFDSIASITGGRITYQNIFVQNK